MNQSPTHTTSFVPIYHWRGGRPHLVDLASDQTGWLACLCLQRKGDVALIPLAWQTNAADEHNNPDTAFPIIPTIHTQALDETAVTLTLQQLQQDGWEINGQLNLTFNGRDTLPNFQQHIQQYLWQIPGEKHGA
ncbi:MAG: hypothetical protein CSA11_03600 [Chloroflexi bacterium]|nr:MAG: hypothetical protein CSA11_03600 [Chloroflexota bacterium]